MPRKILIADDEPSILVSTAMLLRDFGYEVVTCSAADAIVATLEKETPDLLLQDVRMPGLDLEKLVLSLRGDARWAMLPIVIFSASMDLDDIHRRVGAAGMLEKPFKPHELVAALDEALGLAA